MGYSNLGKLLVPVLVDGRNQTLRQIQGWASVTLHNGKTCLLREYIWNRMVPLPSFPAFTHFQKG
jgi:hypothetical protein